MKRILTPFQWRKIRRQSSPDPLCQQWRRNPLSHPEIAKMDKRALADMPFDPACITAE
ncbi:hypothetical protein [Rhodophyticola sp. CCM32]|uniref:hypothetical protein n=1 Tax=Rhodophyticola sp. CCM32 TaxID=2916397 RepID=UPI00143D8D7E|nr:hypothetical protein [Rhodophyticola sp. CCM32]